MNQTVAHLGGVHRVTPWDIAVVGAGAAGLMTAITARRLGLSALLLDSKEKIGAKILMSGGTRCNVTNQNVTERDFESEKPRVVRDVLAAFPSRQALQFFKELGVDLVLEPGGKYFPTSHSAKTVLNALLSECKKIGVQLEVGKKVTRLSVKESAFEIIGENFSFVARSLVLCTGGFSYPATGSDGSGYELAKAFGHKMIFTTPALTPLTTEDSDWKSLSGVSLPVRLSFKEGNKKRAEFEGSFLFTHFGFSGPAALNISRHWLRSADKGRSVDANFLPHDNEETFRTFLAKATEKTPSRRLRNLLADKLPERFVDIFITRLGIREEVILNQLTREERERLFRSLFNYSLPITGVVGYKKAEATAGGIDLGEIDPRTLESKLQLGLFFSGEMLDVDGRIGGFNFQWAWSSGVTAARGAARYIQQGGQDETK